MKDDELALFVSNNWREENDTDYVEVDWSSYRTVGVTIMLLTTF